MSPNGRLLLPPLALFLCLGLARGDADPSPEPPGDRITAANAARLRELPAIDKDVFRIIRRHDGKQVAFVGWERPVEILDAAGLRPLQKLGADRKVISFAFSPDGDVVALGENGTGVEILNLRTKKSIRLDVGKDQASLAFSPDGKLLATGGYHTGAKVWEAATGKLVRALDTGPTQGGLTVVFSPDGKVLAVGNRNSTTRLFAPATGKLLHTLDRRMSHELRFHPDGKTLAVAYVDGSLRLWEVASGKLVHEAKAKAAELYALDWSPRGDLLVTSGRNAAVTLWDPKRLSVVKTLEAPEWVIGVRFTPDGTQLLAAGGGTVTAAGRKVRVWGVR